MLYTPQLYSSCVIAGCYLYTLQLYSSCVIAGFQLRTLQLYSSCVIARCHLRTLQQHSNCVIAGCLLHTLQLYSSCVIAGCLLHTLQLYSSCVIAAVQQLCNCSCILNRHVNNDARCAPVTMIVFMSNALHLGYFLLFLYSYRRILAIQIKYSLLKYLFLGSLLNC